MLTHSLPQEFIPGSAPVSEPWVYDPGSLPKLPWHLWAAVLVAVDVLGAMFVATAMIGFGTSSQPRHFAVLLAISGAVWLGAASAQGLYRSSHMIRDRAMLARMATSGVIAYCAFSALVLVINKNTAPHGHVELGWMTCAVFWVIATRSIWHACLQAKLQRGYTLSHVLVLAETAQAAKLLAIDLERRHGGRLRVAASVAMPDQEDECALREIEDTVRLGCIDRGFFAEADPEDGRASHAARILRQRLRVSVKPIPASDVIRAEIAYLGREGVLADSMAKMSALRDAEAFMKRAEDLALAICLLITFLPLGLMLAVLIKLDSAGPVFFVQPRIGLHSRTFRMWKFRTMYHDMADISACRQTSRNDQRVTRAGRLLRKTSLDELPQLLNVLRGEMSVVGPRPHALGMTISGRDLSDICLGYMARYRVKPGITGLAQVNGCRGELNCSHKLRRRVALDCQYAESWSLRNDAKIILQTIALFAFDRHAY